MAALGLIIAPTKTQRPMLRHSEQLFQIFFRNYHFVTKIVLTYCEKKCSSDRDKILKFEDEGREFAKFLRSPEQFIQTVKGQNSFW